MNKRLPESHDDYPGTLHIEDNHRVILCRDAIQYIIQRQKTIRGKPEWRSLRFCTCRRSLIRDWQEKTGNPAPREYDLLAEKARDHILENRHQTPEISGESGIGHL